MPVPLTNDVRQQGGSTAGPSSNRKLFTSVNPPQNGDAWVAAGNPSSAFYSISILWYVMDGLKDVRTR